MKPVQYIEHKIALDQLEKSGIDQTDKFITAAQQAFRAAFAASPEQPLLIDTRQGEYHLHIFVTKNNYDTPFHTATTTQDRFLIKEPIQAMGKNGAKSSGHFAIVSLVAVPIYLDGDAVIIRNELPKKGGWCGYDVHYWEAIVTEQILAFAREHQLYNLEFKLQAVEFDPVGTAEVRMVSATERCLQAMMKSF